MPTSRDFLNAATAARWLARLAGAVAVGVILLFAVGEGMNPSRFTGRDWVLFILFPGAVVLGAIVGWRREAWGGAIALAGLAGFYAVHYGLSGGFPRGWAFAVFALPGALFLVAAALRRLGQKRGASSSAPAAAMHGDISP